jgi:hypothetical protein
MGPKRLVAGATALVAAMGLAIAASVGSVAEATPPPPPGPAQMTISFVKAVLVAHGAAVNVTVNVTCPDLSGFGDGYEYFNNADGDGGQAGGAVGIGLSQASGKTLASGQGVNGFNPDPHTNFNGSFGPCTGVWTFDSDSQQWVYGGTTSFSVTVQVFANTFNGGAPFKAGTAFITQGNGQECGELVQGGGGGNGGNNGPQCDNTDQFNGSTGDPASFGNLPSQTIRITTR